MQWVTTHVEDNGLALRAVCHFYLKWNLSVGIASTRQQARLLKCKFWGLNSGPYAFETSILPTELLPQSVSRNKPRYVVGFVLLCSILWRLSLKSLLRPQAQPSHACGWILKAASTLSRNLKQELRPRRQRSSGGCEIRIHFLSPGPRLRGAQATSQSRATPAAENTCATNYLYLPGNLPLRPGVVHITVSPVQGSWGRRILSSRSAWTAPWSQDQPSFLKQINNFKPMW